MGGGHRNPVICAAVMHMSPLAPSGRQKGAKPLVGLVSLASNRLKLTRENRPRATIFQPTNASQHTERRHRQLLNFKIPVPTIPEKGCECIISLVKHDFFFRACRQAMMQPTRVSKWKHARLTRPTKGFAPFWRPLGARGGSIIVVTSSPGARSILTLP